MAIPEWLRWVVGLLFTLLFIAATIFIYNVIQSAQKRAQEQAISQTSELVNAEFSTYDNSWVTGTDVMAAARRHLTRPQFSIRVITGANSVGYWVENSDGTCYEVNSGVAESVSCGGSQVSITDMSDTAQDLFYVNPTARFKSSVYRDVNQEVRLIEFIQH